jgi:hypothetical protein
VQSLSELSGLLKELLIAVIPEIGPQPDDECSNALGRARL